MSISCPACGALVYGGHSQDGRFWKFVCRQCGTVFTVDKETGKII